MRKKAIIQVLNDLPSEVKLDDVIERLIVLEKIEIGLTDIKAAANQCRPNRQSP